MGFGNQSFRNQSSNTFRTAKRSNHLCKRQAIFEVTKGFIYKQVLALFQFDSPPGQHGLNSIYV